jgi:hypothetical protein
VIESVVIPVAGALAGAFALALLLLPAVRVAQGRLSLRQAGGLWIAGAGFALLAAAAFLVPPDRTGTAIVIGVSLAVAGNILQRRNTRP